MLITTPHQSLRRGRYRAVSGATVGKGGYVTVPSKKFSHGSRCNQKKIFFPLKIFFPGSMVEKCNPHTHLAPGSLVPWFPDSPVPWFPGSLVPWFPGSLFPWFPGSLLPWVTGSRIPIRKLLVLILRFELHGESMYVISRQQAVCDFYIQTTICA